MSLLLYLSKVQSQAEECNKFDGLIKPTVSKRGPVNRERDKGRIDGLAFAIATCRGRAQLYEDSAALEQVAVFFTEKLLELMAQTHDKRKIESQIRCSNSGWLKKARRET